MPGGRVLRVGLTGGIACGKSHVLARFAAAGFGTIDLDRVAHEVMAPGGPAYDDVVRAFGPEILASDGTIDRGLLGEKVFADAGLRARLNSLVHPWVRAEEARRVRAAPAGIVVTDAALLVESGVHLQFDRLVVVCCALEEQIKRLGARNGLVEASARARIGAQMPTEEKRRFAHFVVDTSGLVAETDRAVDGLVEELRALSSNRPAPFRVPFERALGSLLRGPSRGPAGLTPARLLEDIVEAGGAEMERIARLLQPRREGPWYHPLPPAPEGPGPESLMAPVVLWTLARQGPDPSYLVAASASLARLTHDDPSAIAGASVFALALQELALLGREASLASRLEDWRELGRRWADGSPPAVVVRAIEEAAHRLPMAEESRPRMEGPEPLPQLVGALLGMVEGMGAEGPAPDELVASVQALGDMAEGLP